MKQTSTTKKLWLAALLVALLATLLCFTASAWTDSGTFGEYGDNLTWSFNTTSGELVISGEGYMENYTSSADVPWYTYSGSIKTVRIGDSVTSIGNYAFADCSSLKGVTIGDSVTSIGSYAFYYCTSLTSVNIPDSVTIGDSVTSIGYDAFYGCSSITSVTIENSVTSIGTQAFSACKSLTSVTIPDSVTSIDYGAFLNSTSLTSVYITDIASWCDISFDTCYSNPLSYAKKLYLDGELVTELVIPDSVTSIGNYAFYGASLTSVNIPDSVTSIGYEAFASCDSLASITVSEKNNVYHSSGNCLIETASKTLIAGFKNSVIPTDGSVTSIGESAFYNCTSLTSVNIPDSVTSIGDDAFYGCTSLTSVTIGDSVTSIGNHAFYECTSLTSVNIPDSVTSIGNLAFYDCTSLTSVNIPDSVTSIGYYAFRNCTSLPYNTYDNAKYLGNTTNPYLYLVEAISKSITTCTIHEDTKLIGASAFNGRSSLTNVEIPDSVTSIGDDAFYNCTSLTSVNIPDSVTSIGDDAFSRCESLIYNTYNNVKYLGNTTNPYLYLVEATSTIINACTIHEDTKLIGYSAFSGCTSLTNVEIPDSVTSIGDWAFEGCTSLTSVTMGNSVTSIGNHAFYECTSLTSVNIPDSVTSIGDGAFYDCDSLASVNIPDSVTSIGELAFGWCENLTSVTIGNSVTSIGKSAFYECTSLTSVTVLSKTTTIYNSSSTIYSGATIYGYAGSTAEAYATKYDRTFVALDVAPIAYQVTKGENGEFSLRAIAGLNSLDYANFGYEITITTKDEDGNDVVKTVSGVSTKAYSSIFGGTTEYSIKEHFGYEYAGLATVTGLAVDSEYTKIEIRSFVTTLDGEVKYGKSGTLLYTGTLDENEFPTLELVTE